MGTAPVSTLRHWRGQLAGRPEGFPHTCWLTPWACPRPHLEERGNKPAMLGAQERVIERNRETDGGPTPTTACTPVPWGKAIREELGAATWEELSGWNREGTRH